MTSSIDYCDTNDNYSWASEPAYKYEPTPAHHVAALLRVRTVTRPKRPWHCYVENWKTWPHMAVRPSKHETGTVADMVYLCGPDGFHVSKGVN